MMVASLPCEWTFLSKAKGDNPDRKHSTRGQLRPVSEGRSWCTNMATVPASLLRPFRSVHTSQYFVPVDNDLCGKREWGLSHNHSPL